MKQQTPPTSTEYATVRDLATRFPAMYEYHYKWRKTESPELEKDIEEVLYEHGFKFKDEDDRNNAGEYNDLKGYLNCEIIPI